jgi:carboxypeptidase family protein
MAIAPRTILIALAMAVPLAAMAMADDTPKAATVEGSVINIQNSRAIPRATVTLWRVKGLGSKSARADGNGHFIFEYVEPGTYRLMAEHQGFFADERRRESEPVFEVAAGDHVRNMPVRLVPAAIISGEVRDEYSDPVQNVAIKLLAMRMRLGQMYLSPAGNATTDDRGEYRIAGLHPGKYYVVAEYKSQQVMVDAVKTAIAEKLVEQTQAGGKSHGNVLKLDVVPETPEPAYTYPPMFYPATGDFRQAQAISLNPGDEVPANFLLISTPVVSIRGRVTNGMTGRPPTGASVAAFWTPYMEGEGMPARVSSEDGTFEIRGLAPGTYTVRANFNEDKQTYEGEGTVEVGNQGAQNVQIAALPDFAASGHVTIVDTKVPMARVLVEFAGEGTMPRVMARAGYPDYKFDAQLRPERRYRAAVRNLPEDYYLKSLAISGHDVPPDNVVVSGIGGQMEIVLSPTGARIEGILFDAKEEPTRGSILLVPDASEPGPPDLFRRAGADSKGKFTLRGVAPGSYRLVALESVSLETEINDPDFLRTIGNRGQALIVEESGKYTVSLKLDGAESK